MNLFELPAEIRNQILGLVFEDNLEWAIPGPCSISHTHLSALHTNRELRRLAIPFFVDRTTICTTPTTMYRLEDFIGGDILKMARKLRLYCDDYSNGERPFTYITCRRLIYSLPTDSAHLLPSLRDFALGFDLSHASIRSLSWAWLIPPPKTTHKSQISLIHYSINRSSTYPAEDFRTLRRWTVTQPSMSDGIELGRLLATQKLERECLDVESRTEYQYLSHEIPDLLCCQCYASKADISNPATRIVCLLCHMAVFCSNNCKRGHDCTTPSSPEYYFAGFRAESGHHALIPDHGAKLRPRHDRQCTKITTVLGSQIHVQEASERHDDCVLCGQTATTQP